MSSKTMYGLLPLLDSIDQADKQLPILHVDFGGLMNEFTCHCYLGVGTPLRLIRAESPMPGDPVPEDKELPEDQSGAGVEEV